MVSTDSLVNLPPIPDKRYFTIGEVSKLCALKPHVLRYWEQEFPQLTPNKRRGNRRYYQGKDIELIRAIRTLLYEQGFTISGAKQKLKLDKGKVEQPSTPDNQSNISTLIDDLEQLLMTLKGAGSQSN